jgi:hypothetical protein
MAMKWARFLPYPSVLQKFKASHPFLRGHRVIISGLQALKRSAGKQQRSIASICVAMENEQQKGAINASTSGGFTFSVNKPILQNKSPPGRYISCPSTHYPQRSPRTSCSLPCYRGGSTGVYVSRHKRTLPMRFANSTIDFKLGEWEASCIWRSFLLRR